MRVVTAPMTIEGAGFQVRRPFPGIDVRLADPFLLLDHLGAVEYAPGEAKGAPWHPHRGFETVTYVIAGDLAGHAGPGVTWTPITYAHASIAPGARLQLPWRADFNALVYVLAGNGSVGAEQWPVREGQLAVFGAGDAVTVQADARQDSRTPSLEVLLLGGRPLHEPVAFYGPFVMNTRDEIVQAIQDYHAGRMGTIPATYLAP